jgi:hypothetical protein
VRTLLNVEADEGCCVDKVAEGVLASVFGSGLLVHPHLHAITRLACDMVSSDTLDVGTVRKALFEKSILVVVLS